MHGSLGWMHVYSAFTALGAGVAVILVGKGTALHRATGLAYVFSMFVVNATALSLYNMTGHFGAFHALALVSLACTLMGLAQPLLKHNGWLMRHYLWMARSYLGLLAAAVAEALVRLPALHVNTTMRDFELGIGAAILLGGVGAVMIPRLKRTALRYQSAKKS
jgi:uncharacterized membrane protein